MTTTAPLHLAAITPINLPRFTILFGPAGSGQKELASALSDLDPGIAIMDLESPLRAATMELFWGGFEYELDLTDKTQLDAPFPLPNPQPYDPSTVLGHGIKSNKDWLDAIAMGLRNNLGEDILARIALREIERMLIHHERIIFRDVNTLHELATLNNNAPNETVTISFSRATQFPPLTSRKNLVFLHSSDPTENISVLLRELGDLP